jgi:trimethylguanosine synthase
MVKRYRRKRNVLKRLFIALPSKILRDGEGPVDEYRQFVELFRETGCEVKCPLEEVDWSARKPSRPDVTMKHRLKLLQKSDHLIALPVVNDHKSAGVMGYIFFAAALGISTSVYLRGSSNLDVPWQLVGLRDWHPDFHIHFYQSNLLSGFDALAGSVIKRSVADVEDTSLSAEDEKCPFGEEYQVYWRQRKQLFSRWDSGIQCDPIGLCSIKPEEIAGEIAAKLTGDCVLDAFAGLGGSSIAFARAGKKVIAYDSSKERLRMAEHNAKIYGVGHAIRFEHGNVFQAWRKVRGEVDAVYLDPSWGGPAYSSLKSFDFADFEIEGNGDVRSFIADAYCSKKSVAISLPKNFDTRKLTDLHSNLIRIENGRDPKEGGIQISWHKSGTRILFLTAFL